MMENPSLNEEHMVENPDDKVIPGCGVVLSKCLGEMVGILLYLGFCSAMIIVSIDTLGAGKPVTCALELLICFVID